MQQEWQQHLLLVRRVSLRSSLSSPALQIHQKQTQTCRQQLPRVVHRSMLVCVLSDKEWLFYVAAHGIDYFKSASNWLDTFIVWVVGVFLLWIAPLVFGAGGLAAFQALGVWNELLPYKIVCGCPVAPFGSSACLAQSDESPWEESRPDCALAHVKGFAGRTASSVKRRPCQAIRAIRGMRSLRYFRVLRHFQSFRMLLTGFLGTIFTLAATRAFSSHPHTVTDSTWQAVCPHNVHVCEACVVMITLTDLTFGIISVDIIGAACRE